MIPGMPILGQHDIGEKRPKAIDSRDDLVAMGYRKVATGTEVILNVDDEQDIGRADRQRVCHVSRHGDRLSCSATRRSQASASATKASATSTSYMTPGSRRRIRSGSRVRLRSARVRTS